MYEHMSSYCTPRRCVECLQPASFWRFITGRFGKNLSSRQPVCEKNVGATESSEVPSEVPSEVHAEGEK